MDKKYIEERPWGMFEQFCLNEVATVKIITVKPHSKLSLQYHNKRDEFWRVISGNGVFVLGDDVLSVQKGDELFIERGVKHRIETGDNWIEVLEISFGEFDEDDIVRIDDEYGRN